MTHHCVFLSLGGCLLYFYGALQHFMRRYPCTPLGEVRLPAKHCHGAALHILMYHYWASFFFFPSIIGRTGSHESLVLLSIEEA